MRCYKWINCKQQVLHSTIIIHMITDSSLMIQILSEIISPWLAADCRHHVMIALILCDKWISLISAGYSDEDIISPWLAGTWLSWFYLRLVADCRHHVMIVLILCHLMINEVNEIMLVIVMKRLSIISPWLAADCRHEIMIAQILFDEWIFTELCRLF